MSILGKAFAEIVERAATREEAQGAERVAAGAGVRAAARGAGSDLGSKIGDMIAAASPPPAINARSGTAAANAADVLAAAKAKSGPSFAVWSKRNANPGQLLDMHNLAAVPDVPQTQMPRVVPPRGPSPRMRDALANPDVQRGLNDTVERGAQNGGLEWYNTEPLRERMGYATDDPSAYARLMDMIAATSPRSKVADNIRTASYYNYLLANGLPIPREPAPGYGSVAQKLHTSNVRGVADLGGWDVFRNPKPASFSSNLQGNQLNTTIDTHNMRLPAILSQDPRFLMGSMVADKGAPPVNPAQMFRNGEITINDALMRPTYWATKPRENEYGYYEKWQQDQARKMGISPAQYQASMWLGGGDTTGLGSTPEPFLHTFENRVRYTADRLGVDPNALLEQVIAGKVPLLKDGGRVSIDQLAAKYC